MKNNKLTINFALALIVWSFCIYFSDAVIFDRLKLMSYDLLFSSRMFWAKPSKEIIIIQLTSSDIKEYVTPWSRSKIGELCKALNYFGADQILLDFLFTKNQEEQIMVNVVKEEGNIYMPFILRIVPSIGRFEINETFLPIQGVIDNVKGMGFVNIDADLDGKIRRFPLYYKKGDILFEHVVLKMIRDKFRLKINNITSGELELSNNNNVLKIPSDQNYMYLNWYGKWERTFSLYSFSDILHAYQDLQDQKPPKIDVSFFKNSICMVAALAPGMHDVRPTVLEHDYPGIGIIATAYANILQNNYLKKVPRWLDLLIVFIFVILSPIYYATDKVSKWLVSLVLLSIFAIFPILFCFGSYSDPSLPFIALLFSYITITLYNFASSKLEKSILVSLSNTDQLTGLNNIRHFKEILKAQCNATKKNTGKCFCVVLCDIDHFKSINDTHGHLVGDYVIANISKAIKCSLRDNDIVGRYGGDELILCLRDVLLDKAYMIVDKIRNNISNIVLNHNNNLYKVTLSMGVAVFDPYEDDMDSVIKKADEALYIAKERGRNCVVAYGK